MESHRNLNKPIRCPKCRSMELQLSEHQPGKIIRYQQHEDQRLIKLKEEQDETAEQYVMATCICDHNWRVRGVKSVTQFNHLQSESLTQEET